MDDTPNYECYLCGFTTTRRTNYIRHIGTKKHIENVSAKNACQYKSLDKVYCECGKAYKHMSGLSRHRPICPVYLMISLDEKQCDHSEIITNEETRKQSQEETLKQSQEETLKQSQEDNTIDEKSGDDIKTILTDIAQQLREMKETQAKQQQQITNNNNYNNNNYILNLNMFLNENCKDALSLQDFVQQITFVFDDLKDKAWRSKVLLNNLGSLQLENRPFHCIDSAACQVVLKNGGQWQQGCKDDIVSTLDSCGKYVQKQFGPQWDLQYPDWAASEKHSRQFMDLLWNITQEPSLSQMEEDVKLVSTKTVLNKNHTAIASSKI